MTNHLDDLLTLQRKWETNLTKINKEIRTLTTKLDASKTSLKSVFDVEKAQRDLYVNNILKNQLENVYLYGLNRVIANYRNEIKKNDD